MKESAFQQQVEQLAQFYGWRIFHAPDNRPSGRTGRVQRVRPGFPDLVLLRQPELLFAELKTDTGRVSPAQREWLDELGRVESALDIVVGERTVLEGFNGVRVRPCVEAHLWRPRDFDTMHARLALGRRQVQPLYRVGAA